MKSNWIIVAGVLAVVVVLAAILSVCLTRDPIVNRANYNSIRCGMSEAEIAKLLKGPFNDVVPLGYEDIHSDEQLFLKYPPPYTIRHWKSDTHRISVAFDSQGRVAAKYYTRDPNVHFVRRFIDWLGL